MTSTPSVPTAEIMVRARAAEALSHVWSADATWPRSPG
jgi:hypothetical protein